MASFVIHNIAAEKLIKTLEEEYGVSIGKEAKNQFLLGNLIVDSSKLKYQQIEGKSPEEGKKEYRKKTQLEKVSTHFRNEDDANLCIQKPNLDKFLNKYGMLMSLDLSALGYFYHLFTDKKFFDDLFTKSFDTLDDNANHTIYTSETKMMKVNKNNKICGIKEFWSPDSKTSIYHDYTVMNKILLEYYGSSFDKDGLSESSLDFVNPGIEEVDYSNITSIINKTDSFIKDSYSISDSELYVFDSEVVIEFISEVVHEFIQNYLLYFVEANESSKEGNKLVLGGK